jgi:drug/metabolite transporter (DMT)-like permease
MKEESIGNSLITAKPWFTMKKHQLAAFGLLGLAQISVGINITGSKFLISTFPLLFILTGRFFLAAVLLLPLHWCTRERKISLKQHFQQLNARDWLFLFLQAICAGVFFNLLMVLGLRYTSAQSAGIITSTLPALIAIASCIFLKEQFTFKKSICVGFATLGLIIISVHQVTSSPRHTDSLLWGNLLVFLALFPETAYYVLAKVPTKRLPIFLMSGIINAINAIILIPFLIFQVHWPTLHFSILNLGVLILVGVCSGMFYVFWFLGSDKVDTILASLATTIMPISTVLIAWLVLNENLSIYYLVGMILAILSIIAYAV